MMDQIKECKLDKSGKINCKNTNSRGRWKSTFVRQGRKRVAFTNFSFLLTLVSTDENDQTHHELPTADKGDNDVRSKQKALTRLLPLDYQAAHGVNLLKCMTEGFTTLCD